MMEPIEFDPVDHITVGAVGAPGKRTFMLQARRGVEVLTLVVEKTQVLSLSEGVSLILTEAGHSASADPDDAEMALDETKEPEWRVGELTLGFDETKSMFVIECRELLLEEELPIEPAQPRSARFFLTIDQLGAMGMKGLKVASKGRPICPHCALPMDPEGHFCAATNGHKEVRI